MSTPNYQVLIRESHIDTLGHVNNAVYFKLFEEARWEMMAKRGMSIESIQRGRKSPIILDISAKFLLEIKLRETIDITYENIEFKGKVGKFKQLMIKENGDIACEAIMTFGFFDLNIRRLIEPTQNMIEAWDLIRFF